MFWVGAYGFFSLKEFIHAFFSDHFLVLNHTHAITRTVQLVEFGEVVTGHVGALVAEADLFFSGFFAVPFNKRAVFVAHEAARAVRDFAFFVGYTAAVGEVGFADAAVHAARRN